MLTMQYYAQVSMRRLFHAQPAYQFNWLQWCSVLSLSKESAGASTTYNKQTTDNRQEIMEFMTSRPHSVKRFTCTNKTQTIYPWLPSVEIILWFHQYIWYVFDENNFSRLCCWSCPIYFIFIEMLAVSNIKYAVLIFMNYWNSYFTRIHKNWCPKYYW